LQYAFSQYRKKSLEPRRILNYLSYIEFPSDLQTLIFPSFTEYEFGEIHIRKIR